MLQQAVGELAGETLKTFTARDGQQLCYRSSGPASTIAVVLIHGLASNMSRWTEFCTHSSLNQDLHLIRIDLRGHGCSQTHRSYNKRDWVADLQDLQQHEGIQQFIIVGHSMGAQLGLHYALASPQQTRGLVLVDPVFSEAMAGLLLWVRKIKWAIRGYKALLRLLYRLGAYNRHLVYRDLYKLDRDTRDYLAAHPDIKIADLYGSPWKDLYYIPIANYLEDMLQVDSPTPALEEIVAPVRILQASAPATSAAQKVAAIVARLPDVQVASIEADHWPLTEQPQKSREAIEAFVRELKSRA